MIYNDLALFTAVARHLNFSEAAARIGIPLSRASRRIAELEDHLGVKLFERTTRQVRLTEEGRRLLDLCQDPIEALQSVAGLTEDTTRHTIRITAPPMAVQDRIGPLLLDFAAENPDIRIDLTTSNTILDFFRDNVDLAFRVGPLQESGLVARKLWTLTYSFCASDSFIDAQGIDGPIALDHLLALPALVSRQPWLMQSGAQIKPHNITHEFDTLDMVAGAARRGMGIAILPRDMVADGLREVSVADAQPTSRDMFAVYPSRRLLPARVRKLIDFMAIS
ncbi:LysR family transcriptional regulator [Phaeobacter sp.]|uniref:LysR family transcriptional regulator n=1 Tax=Phaeobacter sp. TaxID=1902409 RepID=UPI0025F56083|nr:LysR family transcriptional regulator [Phaeobacter sp.]